MDYNTLVGGKSVEGSLKYWVNHDYLPLSEVLADAQNEVYARLRVREMLTTAPLTIAIGTSAVAAPSGFLDPYSLIDQYGGDITLLSSGALREAQAKDGTGTLLKGPISSYAILGTSFLFDMASNTATTFTLDFFQQPAALSASNPTNFLTSRYSHLFRAALLKHAYAFRKSWDEADRYQKELEAQFQAVEVMDDLSSRGLNDPEEFA